MEVCRLQSHVYMCQTNGHFVFLDLKKDEYTGLDRSQTHILEDYFCGARSYYDSEKREALRETNAIGVLLKSLTDGGLLTTEPTGGKPPASTSITQPTAPLLSDDASSTFSLKSTDVWSFFLATAHASVVLRWRSIESIVSQVQSRKRRHLGKSESFDFDKARRLVAMFNALRVFYGREYLCLFDSLALINFLSHYNVYPSWVYGVTAEPFQAHCWVQEGDYVFNEAVEIATNYTPIMAV